jgi:hypothetical protein
MIASFIVLSELATFEMQCTNEPITTSLSISVQLARRVLISKLDSMWYVICDIL